MRERHWFMVFAILLAASVATRSRAEDQAQPAPPAAAAKPSPPAATKEAAPKAAAPAAPNKEPAPPASVTIIGPREAHGILGRDVRSAKGEDMGHIVDVIVDVTGTVRAAVIDFGGFLGVGSRKIVVDWDALHFGHVGNKDGNITLDLTKAQVAAAPEYNEGKPIVVLGAAGKLAPLDVH